MTLHAEIIGIGRRYPLLSCQTSEQFNTVGTFTINLVAPDSGAVAPGDLRFGARVWTSWKKRFDLYEGAFSATQALLSYRFRKHGQSLAH